LQQRKKQERAEARERRSKDAATEAAAERKQKEGEHLASQKKEVCVAVF
jgi:hypothetical protein